MQESKGSQATPVAVGRPTSTVQAPQSPSAQTTFVPTRPSRSRSRLLTVRKASAAGSPSPPIVRRLPLTQQTT